MQKLRISQKPKVPVPSNEGVKRLTVEALLASIPYIGPALSTAVFGALDEKRFQRLERFISELEFRLNEFEQGSNSFDEIVVLLEENERFMLFVRDCVAKLYEEYDEKMFKAYQVAFLRGLLDRSVGVEVKIEFLRYLDRLGTTDLEVLGYLCKFKKGKYVVAKQISAAVSDTSELSKLMVLSSTDTLANLQLIEVGKIGLDSRGNLHREEHNYRLTALGWAFGDFILE